MSIDGLVGLFVWAFFATVLYRVVTGAVRNALRMAQRRRYLPRALRHEARNLQPPNYLRIARLERATALADVALTCSQCGRVGEPNTTGKCWNCGAWYNLSRIASLSDLGAWTAEEAEGLRRTFGPEPPPPPLVAEPRDVTAPRRRPRRVNREEIPVEEALRYLHGRDEREEAARLIKWQQNTNGRRVVAYREIRDGETHITIAYAPARDGTFPTVSPAHALEIIRALQAQEAEREEAETIALRDAGVLDDFDIGG